jgi:uncharacterized ubiquitin-like protein YukD
LNALVASEFSAWKYSRVDVNLSADATGDDFIDVLFLVEHVELKKMLRKFSIKIYNA